MFHGCYLQKIICILSFIKCVIIRLFNQINKKIHSDAHGALRPVNQTNDLYYLHAFLTSYKNANTAHCRRATSNTQQTALTVDNLVNHVTNKYPRNLRLIKSAKGSDYSKPLCIYEDSRLSPCDCGRFSILINKVTILRPLFHLAALQHRLTSLYRSL